MVSTTPLDQWAERYLDNRSLNAENKKPLARVLFFSGKGGVGRTTLATKMAQQLAQQGRRTLLVHVLTHEQLRGEPQAIEKKRPNLWAIRLRSQECFEEYIALKLKLKALGPPQPDMTCTTHNSNKPAIGREADSFFL